MENDKSHVGLHCLKIRNLSVKRGGTVILENVNLHIHCGGITAVIGRNGAGKSTLLKAILKEIPSEGEVEFSGHDGKKVPSLRIGYVPKAWLWIPVPRHSAGHVPVSDLALARLPSPRGKRTENG